MSGDFMVRLRCAWDSGEELYSTMLRLCVNSFCLSIGVPRQKQLCINACTLLDVPNSCLPGVMTKAYQTAVLKVTGPLEVGLRVTVGSKDVHKKSKLRAALSGLEDKFSADQAELGIAHIIQQISSAGELERTLKQVLETDRCSTTAARHRYRSAPNLLTER